MTNFEKIKAMNIDELAEFSNVFQRCKFCINQEKDVVQFYKCIETTCKDAIKQWLESESEVE